MQTEKLGIGISIRGVDANIATAAEMSTIKDLLYKNRLIVLKDQAVSEQQYCDFANRFGYPGSLSAGELPPPRLPADLRLLERQEGRQADRRSPHRRLLALRHLLRDRSPRSSPC